MATAVPRGERKIDLAAIAEFGVGPARAYPALLELRCDGKTEIVEPRVMQMLVALHGSDGKPLSRDDLIELCWGGLAVSDDAINQSVSKLRRALALVPGVQVVSVPRVGYRLSVGAADATGSVDRQAAVTRRTALAGAAIVSAGAGTWYIVNRGFVPDDESVAVLPFENLSGEESQAYLAEGIAEEVRTALARLDGLKVVGRTSSETVRTLDVQSAAAKLNAESVLTGSVRRSATTIRVTAQLVDGRTGYERWSQSYDLAPGQALQVQTEIAQAVALALSVRLNRSNRMALAIGGTRSDSANNLYLQAKLAFRLSDTEPTFRKVIALCDAAIDLDANYASAHALRGMAWDAIGGSFAVDTRALHDAYAQGAESGRKAIRLAPRLAAGYVALGRAMSGQLNVSESLEQYRKAEPLIRTDPGVISWWIQTLAEIGRTSEALALAQRLMSLDPLNAMIFSRTGFAHFYARRYSLAIATASKALAMAPGLTEQHGMIGDCLCLMGKYPEARIAYAKAPALDPYRMTGEGLVAARIGDRAGAERVLDHLNSYGEPISYCVAQIHAQLGQIDEAFAALGRGLRALDPGMDGLPADPFVDPLRRDPRFGRLLAVLNLPAGN